MPKKAIDYSKTIIYKIVPKDLNLNFIYVGSTTDFRRRKSQHKYECNNNNLLKIYKTIRENGGWDAFEMIEIEKYKCNDGIEARIRERYWMELFNANLNILKAITTKEEYKEYNKEWYENNKDELLCNKKIYYQNNKEIIKQNIDDYYIININKILLYKKNNKDKINERRRQLYLEKKLKKNNI